jgi:F-type H+-transporting ATPase subunit b
MLDQGPEKGIMAQQRNRSRSSFVRFAISFAMVMLTTSFMLVESAAASEGKLVLVPEFTTLLPLMILLFVVLIIPVNALLFKPIFRVLEDREEKINGTLKRAERLAEEAENTLARYNDAIREVRDEVEAKRKHSFTVARNSGGEKTQEARSAAESEIERARNEVQNTLEQARATLRSQAEELAKQAAERVLGRPLS